MNKEPMNHHCVFGMLELRQATLCRYTEAMVIATVNGMQKYICMASKYSLQSGLEPST